MKSLVISRGEKFESRAEINDRESCSRKRCFRSVTDRIREELDISYLAPFVQMSQVYGPQFSFKALVVIVPPLLSIIGDQVKWLRSRGLAAAYIGESNDNDRNVIDGQGNFNFVYGSPESLACDRRFRDMFFQDFFRRNTVAIVCDEVHTVVDW